jgi:two-component system, NarL family, response regulator NreC
VVSVIIADDHAIVRAGMRALIDSDPDLELVGEAVGGVEAIDLVQQLAPDVLVLDLSMPDLDGIAVTRQLKTGGSTVKILILTVHEDEGLLREAIKSGASGYILKHAAEAELIQAIKAIITDTIYVDPIMMRALLIEPQGKPLSPTLVRQLTPRELEILQRIAYGYTNRQISEELMISIRTVEGHRANIMDKLNLRSRVELVRYAKRHHLIE